MSSAIRTVRTICLALPEATERETWGDPTFRVGEKIFAMVKSGDGRVSVWLKPEPGMQEPLIANDPERYFFPPYVGSKGWVGIRLDLPPDPEELADAIRTSYRQIAPKRLARLV